MRSHELAKLLLEKPDVELILQRDSEGNGYSPLRGVDYDVIHVSGGWDTTVYSTEWDADEADMDEEEWEELKRTGANKHAVLYP